MFATRAARRAWALWVATAVALASRAVAAAAPVATEELPAADLALGPAVPTAASWRPPPPLPPSRHDAMLADVPRLRQETAAAPSGGDDDDGPPRGIGINIPGGALVGPGTLAFTLMVLLVGAFSGGFCGHCTAEKPDTGAKTHRRQNPPTPVSSCSPACPPLAASACSSPARTATPGGANGSAAARHEGPHAGSTSAPAP